MDSQFANILLAVISAVLGGGNIFQFVQMRELKRKSSADAYQSEINSLRLIIDGNVQEIKRLQGDYAELQDRYFALAEELQKIKANLPSKD